MQLTGFHSEFRHTDKFPPGTRTPLVTRSSSLFALGIYEVIHSSATAALYLSKSSLVAFCPILLRAGEQAGGMWAQGNRWREGKVVEGATFTAETSVRLLRHGIVR